MGAYALTSLLEYDQSTHAGRASNRTRGVHYLDPCTPSTPPCSACVFTFASVKLRDSFRKLVRVCMMERWRDGDCTSPFLQGMDPSPPRIVIEEHSSVDEDHRSPASSPLPLTPSTHPGEEEEEEEGGASTFAKLVRTIQFIKRWAGRGERPPDPRDAFLDRFKVKRHHSVS